MNMPPAARKAYSAFLILAVGLYVSFLGYRAYTEIQKRREYAALEAQDKAGLFLPLADAVNAYTAAHGGQLPKDISIAQLLAQTQTTAPYLEKITDNPQAHLRWNTAVQTLPQASGNKPLILWLEDDRHSYYATALVDAGKTCQAEIIVRSELRGLTGEDAKLK